MSQVNSIEIREAAAKIKAKVGTLKLHGQLTDRDAEAILKDTDIIIGETA